MILPSFRPRLIAPLILAVMLAAPTVAAASVCPVPQLGGPDAGSDAASMGRSRDAVARYEACLTEHAEVLALFDPDGAQRLDRQRDAAAQLKRTLDAWIKARSEADARSPAL